jgi:hypothetical protein
LGWLFLVLLHSVQRQAQRLMGVDEGISFLHRFMSLVPSIQSCSQLKISDYTVDLFGSLNLRNYLFRFCFMTLQKVNFGPTLGAADSNCKLRCHAVTVLGLKDMRFLMIFEFVLSSHLKIPRIRCWNTAKIGILHQGTVLHQSLHLGKYTWFRKMHNDLSRRYLERQGRSQAV